MRKSVLFLASVVAALVLASVMALGIPKEQAKAAFPGANGKIAFVSDRAGNNDIYTISFTGNNLKRLTDNAESEKMASWSPDGKKIVYRRGRNLYTMNADGSNQRKIPNTAHRNHEEGTTRMAATLPSRQAVARSSLTWITISTP